jgi:hypothetical protein
MNTMIYSHLLLIYVKHVLRGHFLKYKINLTYIKGRALIFILSKAKSLKLNVSFNCVVNIYQKGGDCKCNQALSGFW